MRVTVAVRMVVTMIMCVIAVIMMVMTVMVVTTQTWRSRLQPNQAPL